MKVIRCVFTIGCILVGAQAWADQPAQLNTANINAVNTIATVVFAEQTIEDPAGLTALGSSICNAYKPATSSDSEECLKDMTECNASIAGPLREKLDSNCTAMCLASIVPDQPCKTVWKCQATAYNTVISDQNLTSADLKKKITTDCTPSTVTAENTGPDVTQQGTSTTTSTTTQTPTSKGSGGCSFSMWSGAAGSASQSLVIALGILSMMVRRKWK